MIAILHKSLASELNISSQALSWRISRLKKTGLVDITGEQMNVKYFVTEEKTLLLNHCISLANF
jgi:predicted transcriptional regulator